MELKAFEKGIVRIESENVLCFDDANELAIQYAGGLPTQEEIVSSELHSKDLDFWTYALSEGGYKGR